MGGESRSIRSRLLVKDPTVVLLVKRSDRILVGGQYVKATVVVHVEYGPGLEIDEVDSSSMEGSTA